jgi:5-methylcytosine-specific restriction enzyme A
MKNPKWHRDEIILALDLYFSQDRGPIDFKNPKIVNLSQTLNALPLFSFRPDQEKFRNPNGVALKLSNFLAIDPNYQGKGMTGGSKLDEKIFLEFSGKRKLLREIAIEIRNVINSPILTQEILAIDENEDEDNFEEGRIMYKLHKVRERNPKIVKRKKEQQLRLHGKLTCEICGFNFEAFYGPIGKAFIECHHRTPLASLKVASKTTLEDLALVCSNCHRMLHKEMRTLSVDILKECINLVR